MSRCRSGSRPPTRTSSGPGSLRSTSQSHSEQKLVAGCIPPTFSATQASDAEGVKLRRRVSSNDKVLLTDARTNESSSGRPMATEVDWESRRAQRSLRGFAGPSASKQAGKRKATESETDGFNGRADTQQSTGGVVYLGHIPSGFNEPQMLRFFSQFGEVVGVELRRSRKTGQSKGYAYIGFELPEVAEVVAETMNNYMMFGRILDCQVVAPSRVPPGLFRHCGKKFRRRSTRVRAAQQHNKPENALPSLRQVKRRLEKERKLAKHLKDLGMEHISPTVVDTLKKTTETGAGASKEGCESPDPTKNLRKTLNKLCRVVKMKGKKTTKHLASKKKKASSTVLSSIT